MRPLPAPLRHPFPDGFPAPTVLQIYAISDRVYAKKTANQHGMTISGMREGAPIPFFLGQRDPSKMSAPRAVIPCGLAFGAAFLGCPLGRLGVAIPSVKAFCESRTSPQNFAPPARLHRRPRGLAGGARKVRFSPPKTFTEGGASARVAPTPRLVPKCPN